MPEMIQEVCLDRFVPFVLSCSLLNSFRCLFVELWSSFQHTLQCFGINVELPVGVAWIFLLENTRPFWPSRAPADWLFGLGQDLFRRGQRPAASMTEARALLPSRTGSSFGIWGHQKLQEVFQVRFQSGFSVWFGLWSCFIKSFAKKPKTTAGFLPGPLGVPFMEAPGVLKPLSLLKNTLNLSQADTSPETIILTVITHQ